MMLCSSVSVALADGAPLFLGADRGSAVLTERTAGPTGLHHKTLDFPDVVGGDGTINALSAGGKYRRICPARHRITVAEEYQGALAESRSGGIAGISVYGTSTNGTLRRGSGWRGIRPLTVAEVD